MNQQKCIETKLLYNYTKLWQKYAVDNMSLILCLFPTMVLSTSVTWLRHTLSVLLIANQFER